MEVGASIIEQIITFSMHSCLILKGSGHTPSHMICKILKRALFQSDLLEKKKKRLQRISWFWQFVQLVRATARILCQYAGLGSHTFPRNTRNSQKSGNNSQRKRSRGDCNQHPHLYIWAAKSLRYMAFKMKYRFLFYFISNKFQSYTSNASPTLTFQSHSFSGKDRNKNRDRRLGHPSPCFLGIHTHRILPCESSDDLSQVCPRRQLVERHNWGDMT